MRRANRCLPSRLIRGGGRRIIRRWKRALRASRPTRHIITNVGDLRADVRRLESRINSHFITLAGMLIAAVIGLAGLIAKGFHWL